MNSLIMFPPRSIAISGSSRSRQTGAAIVIAMLGMLLVTLVAAQAIGALSVRIEATQGYRDQAQARALARSAIDWARNVLADDAMRTSNDNLMEPWALRVPPTRLSDDTLISGEIIEQSGLFNVNNLIFEGRVNPLAGQQFARLLGLAGLAADEAGVLTGRLQAWLRAAHASADLGAGRVLDVYELRAVPGFTPELLAVLSSWVTALPGQTRVNVNTAPAAVLYAMVEGLSLDGAQQLVTRRGKASFESVSGFIGHLPAGAELRLPQQFDVTSRYFIVNGRASHGVAVATMAALLDRRTPWADVLWVRML